MDTVTAPPIPNAGLAPPPPATSSATNNSIYINNLNEKIKRDDLKKSLYAVFVQFGKILDIITGKNLKMNGQAFVVFDELNSATNALRAMQGFPLYEKPMRIQFARKDSDLISKRNGTFQPRPYHLIKRDSDTAKPDPMSGLSARAIRRRQQRQGQDSNGLSAHAIINPLNIPDQPPNKILFLTNLPNDSSEAMISALFTQFTGFREVRMVPGRHDIAFVEFDSDAQAGTAKNGLQGFNIKPNKPIKITFAKK
ncbi:hypothetical protein Ciccas_005418 [Cichlidogyrus casuarinus]|uniref:RRM domain-containing protein n=1 Tax=Cichlidogyrus casuarinus TaxID=1844966 RepID=A0ABD2Q9N9_9PLAT